MTNKGKNKQKIKNIVLKVSPVKLAITPFFMAKISEDLHRASEAYRPEKRVPLINYFLYLASIERGLKAAILSKECTEEIKCYIKNCIGHDLVKAYKEFKKFFELDLFTDKDLSIFKKVNKRYRDKGFEYFAGDMLEQAMKKFKDLPKIEEIREISKKINQFLERNNYFLR